MRIMASWMLAVAVCASGAWAVDIEWVTIGDPGNASDDEVMFPDGTTGYGSVDYEYHIGKFEVTAGQYAEFLNAVAADDVYGLYNEQMDVDSGLPYAEYGCNIKRAGMPGGYSYSVAPEWANRPVNCTSWGDAARFSNWLHNGQPSGTQGLGTTEDGAYFLNGATSDAALLAVTRELDARVFIPSEDEWYKAAYYDGTGGVYYDYPTGSNTAPTPEVPPGTDMASGSANYWVNAVPTVGAPYYRTEVGAYNAKPSNSPYGTYDQGGNVLEWNEGVVGSSYRGARGGWYRSTFGFLLARFRIDIGYPTTEEDALGFRVAAAVDSVPSASPKSLLALSVLIACAGVVVLRRAA